MICEFIWRSWLALKLTTRSGSLYCLHDKVADPTASFSSDEHLCVSRQSLTDTELFQFEWVPDQSKSEYDHPWWRFSTAWYGTVRYGSLLGGFPLGTVPGTWYVFSTTSVEVPSSRTVTKTWRENSADHWLAGENRHYYVTELATRDPPLPLYPLDLNQHSQRRIGRNFCLNKRTFCIKHKIAVSLSVEEVQMFLSLMAEERIQRELDDATPKEKALCI